MKDDQEAIANISWEGDSKDVLAGFPDDIRADLGYSLWELQCGAMPSSGTRRMQSIGPGVYELKEADERAWYRVVYLSKIGDTIYVLHCFEKRSRKTDSRDLATAKTRLASVKQRLQEQRADGKRKPGKSYY